MHRRRPPQRVESLLPRADQPAMLPAISSPPAINSSHRRATPRRPSRRKDTADSLSGVMISRAISGAARRGIPAVAAAPAGQPQRHGVRFRLSLGVARSAPAASRLRASAESIGRRHVADRPRFAAKPAALDDRFGQRAIQLPAQGRKNRRLRRRRTVARAIRRSPHPWAFHA